MAGGYHQQAHSATHSDSLALHVPVCSVWRLSAVTLAKAFALGVSFPFRVQLLVCFHGPCRQELFNRMNQLPTCYEEVVAKERTRGIMKSLDAGAVSLGLSAAHALADVSVLARWWSQTIDLRPWPAW